MLNKIIRSIRKQFTRQTKPQVTSSEIRSEYDESTGLCRYFKVDRIVYSAFAKSLTSFRTILVLPEVPFEKAAKNSLAVECIDSEANIGRNGRMRHIMLYNDEKETRISINEYDYPDGSSYFTSYEYPNPEKG